MLLISVDPAHGLSDVLQSRLTDTETQVKGTKGLYARELDIPAGSMPSQALAGEGRAGLRVVRQAGGGPRGAANLSTWRRPRWRTWPAVSVLTDALVQERFKRDRGGSGGLVHRVRLLEVPSWRGWLSALLAVLVKYRAKGLGELADEVAALPGT